MSPIYLGLDCGGSSSRAVALDASGNVLHQGQSGSANLASTPMFRLRQNLTQAVRGCPAPDFVCGCFAGLLTEEDRQRGINLLRELFPSAEINAEPDYAAAFFACEPGTDICVIAGTGSLVCSWSGDRMVKSGGRGYLLGDEGSAFQFGRDALLAYLSNPTGASTALTKCVVDLFNVEDEPGIVSRLYRAPSPQALLAKLAKPLSADARAGVDYALEAVDRNCGLLAGVIHQHIERHFAGKGTIKLCLAGGLWKTSSVFVDALARKLQEVNGPSVTLDRIKSPPVFGAVKLAREIAHGH